MFCMFLIIKNLYKLFLTRDAIDLYIIYYFDYLGRIREGHGHDHLINFPQNLSIYD